MSNFAKDTDVLISRQATIDAIKRCESAYSYDLNNGLILAMNAVADVPIIDAAPVVRCKDCKYQRKGQNECEAWNLCGYRPWQYTPITDEHFCSYAERRTE